MSLTQHLGYGRFRLEDFLPGEEFARFDGGLARVCDPQPSPPPADRVLVWIDVGTSNARKLLLHRTALAYALSAEHARTVESRRRETGDSAPLFPE